jgi:hypothetical protein
LVGDLASRGAVQLLQEEVHLDGKVHPLPWEVHQLKEVPWQYWDQEVSWVVDLDSLEGWEDQLEEANYRLEEMGL